MVNKSSIGCQNLRVLIEFLTTILPALFWQFVEQKASAFSKNLVSRISYAILAGQVFRFLPKNVGIWDRTTMGMKNGDKPC